jgi:thioredoxin reductase (NADPH)
VLTVEELSAIPLFSTLAHPELDRLARSSADLRLSPGEYAVHEGEPRALFVALDGRCEVTKLIEGIERVIGVRTYGQLFGEVPLVLGTPFPAALRAAEPSRVLRIEARDFHVIAAVAPDVALKVGASARDRIEGIQDIAAEMAAAQVTMVGPRWDAACHDVRRFLDRNQISFDWMQPDDPELDVLWPGWVAACTAFPVIRFNDGRVMVQPQTRALAEQLELATKTQVTEYDTIVIGGGPAGLAATVYGASEGLRTVLIEREAPGGQAGTSSRIENYLGFPTGVSGDELASRALQQAKRLGGEVVVTRCVSRIDPAARTVVLDGEEVLRARTIILATGVTWRKLQVDNLDRLVGKGVYYGAARSEAGATQGLDVYLIGAGNSAGQAAMFFANHARSVTLLVRGGSLAKSMSYYLIEQLRGKANVRVELNSEVTAVFGDQHLEAIEVANRADETLGRRECGALFVFIGADAETEWLPPEIARDARGYILTGVDVVKTGAWSLERDPYLLETSVPGIFACGDVRCSSVKRVASGVGEGSMAIAFVHQYLAHVEPAAHPS